MGDKILLFMIDNCISCCVLCAAKEVLKIMVLYAKVLIFNAIMLLDK